MPAMKSSPSLVTALLLTPLATISAASPTLPADFQAKLQTTLTQHLNELLDAGGAIAERKGKTSEGHGGEGQAGQRSPIVGGHTVAGIKIMNTALDPQRNHQR